ncbi:hypothetical protein Tco_0916514 [Tanacetum coccineum]
MAFHNGPLKEEVYVAQLDRFVDPDHPEKVYCLRKSLGTINMGLWYPKDSGFELTAFLDAGHVGCLDTRKSTFGGIQFLGDKLVSWMSKKQDCTAMSSAEVEYMALYASCAQIITLVPSTSILDTTLSKNRLNVVSISRQMNWYEMFDSSRTGGSGK